MLDVSSIMTPRDRLVVISPDLSIDEVRRLMTANGIRHLPVLDKVDLLLGIVSETDVLLAGGGGSRPVAEIMVKSPDTVDARDHIRHAALLMFRRKRSCLPVLQDGRVCGIVTDSDFLSVVITLLEQSEEVEPEADDFLGLDEDRG